MGSDLFALSALTAELNETLRGARVDKIVQPDVDELRFTLRAKGKTVCLCASCNALAPRLHLTESKKNNPQLAPSLCMLLRKHLAVSTLESVTVENDDRIIRLKFNARTEMKDNAVFYLFVEIISRYSNIVFTDENYIILDAVKHLPLEIARDHIVLRGVKYQPVGQDKISYLTAPISVFDNFERGDLHRYILDNISGFSGITVSELIYRAGVENNQSGALSNSDKNALFAVIEEYRNIIGSPLFNPCIAEGKEVFPYPYAICNKNVRFFPTMSEAYDALYTVADGEIRNKARLKILTTAVKHLKTRVEKNIATDLERLEECENMEDFRIKGELIVAYIYKIKKGDTTLICTDYNTGNEVEIPLDEQLTPSKNSAAYYAKYNKLKRTKEFTEKKLIADRLLYNYVLSVEEELNSLKPNEPSTAIEEELAALNAFKKKAQKGKPKKEKPEPPYTYSVDGFTVLRGKNNLQNDELTFRIASSSDTWLHLKNTHGAHVIILSEGRSVPDSVILKAAEIAACSKGASCEVDYTLRRNVKRQPNGHPGQVIYTNYKTIIVNPDEHFEFLKK